MPNGNTLDNRNSLINRVDLESRKHVFVFRFWNVFSEHHTFRKSPAKISRVLQNFQGKPNQGVCSFLDEFGCSGAQIARGLDIITFAGCTCPAFTWSRAFKCSVAKPNSKPNRKQGPVISSSALKRAVDDVVDGSQENGKRQRLIVQTEKLSILFSSYHVHYADYFRG
jgi:hypothetical protein